MKPIPPIIPIPRVLILISRKTSSRAGFWATWNSRLVDWKKVLAPKLSPHSLRTGNPRPGAILTMLLTCSVTPDKPGSGEESFSFSEVFGRTWVNDLDGLVHQTLAFHHFHAPTRQIGQQNASLFTLQAFPVHKSGLANSDRFLKSVSDHPV